MRCLVRIVDAVLERCVWQPLDALGWISRCDDPRSCSSDALCRSCWASIGGDELARHRDEVQP